MKNKSSTSAKKKTATGIQKIKKNHEMVDYIYNANRHHAGSVWTAGNRTHAAEPGQRERETATDGTATTRLTTEGQLGI